MKVMLTYVIVLLCRSENEKTPLVVLPHEVEVLKALHGEDAVRDVEAELPAGIKKTEFDTAEEYSRLQQYYRGNDATPDPVRSALGTLDDFEAMFERKSARNSDGNEGDAGNQKTALLEEAKALGIAANKNWGVDKLKSAIEEAKAK